MRMETSFFEGGRFFLVNVILDFPARNYAHMVTIDLLQPFSSEVNINRQNA